MHMKKENIFIVSLIVIYLFFYLFYLKYKIFDQNSTNS